MALPDSSTAWPPPAWAKVAADIDTNAAWYSGDEKALGNIYSSSTRQRPRQGGGVLATAARWFWGRSQRDNDAARQRLHAPAAADIAATSADLLFGTPAVLQIPEAHEDTANEEALATEERLQEILDLDGFDSTILEAAEIAGGLGGVYLRPMWDQEIADHPMLSVVHADHAVPEFRSGHLRAVTFHTVLHTEGQIVWRHLERHEPGRILHGLYIGRPDNLGIKRPLTEHPDTEDLKEEIILPAGIEGLDVRYVPNVRPNRTHRHLPIGRAHTEGSESFMDALDEAWTSWVRELRLVRPRLIVPNDFLTRAGRGLGASFDLDQEIFTPLDIDPTSAEKAGITVAEFELHTDDYARSCAELFEKIVVTAGFSPSTFGLIGDTAVVQTATQVNARQSRTDSTTARMQRYWDRALADSAYNMLVIDREVLGHTDTTPMRPRVEFGSREDHDERKVAETLAMFRQAQAISTATAVKMAQPDLEGEELDAEVARVLAESGIEVTDPTGGLP